MAQRLTPRERVISILSRPGMTQRKAAELLGVSDRTVRRWVNIATDSQAVKKPSKAHDAALSREAAKAREIIRRQTNKAAAGRQPVPKAKVLPYPQRRIVKRRDASGRAIGGFIESSWVHYDARRLTRAEVMDIVLSLNAQGARVQFIYETYLEDKKVSGYIIFDEDGEPKKIRAASGIMPLENFSRATIEQEMETYYMDGRRLLYIAVMDWMPHSGKRKGKR